MHVVNALSVVHVNAYLLCLSGANIAALKAELFVGPDTHMQMCSKPMLLQRT